MNPFVYRNPVKVIFGAGKLAEAGTEAAKLGQKALIVSYGDGAVASYAEGYRRLRSLTPHLADWACGRRVVRVLAEASPPPCLEDA